MVRFNEGLGLRFSEGTAEAQSLGGSEGSLSDLAGPCIVLDAETRHEAAPGFVHFAVLTTMAEVAAAQAVGAAVVPSTVTVQLLRPAAPGRLVAQGFVVRRGRRLAVAEGTVHTEGRLVAKATITFALI